MKLLNLSICEQVTISTPVDIGSDMEDIYNSLSESGYNLFDSEDSFYQDICTTYTTSSGTDMILSDRKKDIYSTTEAVTMCQTGCTLESYDSTTKKAKCNCDTSTTAQSSLSNLDIDSLFDKNEIKQSFYDTLSNSNFRVLKCYKRVFSSEFRKNIGAIFMTLVTIAFLVFNSLSYVIHQKMINTYIQRILELKYENMVPNSKTNSPDDLDNIKDNIDLNVKAKTNNDKKKKKKKNKKKKKKKGVDEVQIPPKKNKRNKKNKNVNFIAESSNNEMADTNVNNLNNKRQAKSEISVYQNDNTVNNEKIKEKQIIDSKSGIQDTKGNNNENNNDIVNINTLNDQEINDLPYDIAVKIDKRTYFQYYWSLLKKKHLILFTFWPANDYNLYTIKVSLFLLSFGLYFSINGFFFSDDTMHKLYEDKGSYNIVYRIPQILFSTIISAVINVLLKKLSLTEAQIISIKEEKDSQKSIAKSKSIQKTLKLKFIIYLVLSILFKFFFWYFISCFCAVYKNTQIVLIKDTLVSYALSMIYPFGLNLLPGLFRIPALKAEKADQAFKYKIGQIVALI